MRRSPLRRSPEPAPSAAKILGRASSRSHAANLIQRLEERYAAARWLLLTEVRSTLSPYDVLRRADAIALDLYPRGGGWCQHGFELKTSRADWLRELRDPAKCGPFQLFCSAWYLVVPAPWKLVVLSLDELPAGWGLIELGPGKPHVVREAEEREAEPPTEDFLRALFRASQAAAARADGESEVGVEAPLSRINRFFSPTQVGLMCGHVAAVPLFKEKNRPIAIPCFACAAGLPGDRAVVRQAIREAEPADVEELEAELAARKAELGIAPRCACERRGEGAELCARDHFGARGLAPYDAASAAMKAPCRCACHRDEGGGA